jgi:hypothetical protein
MDNRKFWNERYKTLPELGSGAGARGWAASVKQEVLRKIISANDIRAIVDVGCGDMGWYREGMLNNVRYIGVDISDVIIDRNRERFPVLTFIRQDITKDYPKNIQADVCICFDVLLHQCEERQFENALGNVLRITGRHGLISYPTINGDDEAIYQMEITPEAQTAEEEFVKLLGQLDKDRPYGEVRVYHDFVNRILKIDSQVAVRRLTRFRAHPFEDGRTHTVYELSRTGEWLKFR